MNADMNADSGSWDNVLSVLFYRISCPSAETLGDYAMNLLAPGQRLAAAQHLRKCPHCTAELSLYAHPDEETATVGFVQRLINRVRWAAPQPSLQPAPLRGSALRQQVYSADDAMISIEIAPSPSGYQRMRLNGVIDSPLRFTEAELWNEDQARQTVSTAVHEGYFDLSGLAQASYLLCLKADSAELWLGPLVVGPEATSP